MAAVSVAAVAKWEGVSAAAVLIPFPCQLSQQLSTANGALLVSMTAPSFAGTSRDLRICLYRHCGRRSYQTTFTLNTRFYKFIILSYLFM